MIKRFADNRALLTAGRDRIAAAAAEAQARATAAPVFADLSRFGQPSSNGLVWMPTTTGMHPSFV